MKKRFQYYILNKKVYVLDLESSTIVYWNNDAWNEECNMKLDTLKKAKRITRKQALKKTKGHNPKAYVDELINQEILKSIYCP